MNQLAKYDEAMKHLRAMLSLAKRSRRVLYTDEEKQLHDAQHFLKFGEMANEEVKKA
jgi:hypothetical protein